MDKDFWWRVRDEVARTAPAEAVEVRDPGVFRLGDRRITTAPVYEHPPRMKWRDVWVGM